MRGKTVSIPPDYRGYNDVRDTHSDCAAEKGFTAAEDIEEEDCGYGEDHIDDSYYACGKEGGGGGVETEGVKDCRRTVAVSESGGRGGGGRLVDNCINPAELLEELEYTPHRQPLEQADACEHSSVLRDVQTPPVFSRKLLGGDFLVELDHGFDLEVFEADEWVFDW